jgi:biotin operon repressor
MKDNRLLNDTYVKGISTVRACKKLTVYEKIIIHYVYSWTVDGKPCYATNQTIADAEGISKSIVVKSIASLKKKGILIIKNTINTHSMMVDIDKLTNYVFENTKITEENNITINQQTQETMIVKVNPLASQAAQDWAIELNNCEAEEDFVETIVEKQPTQPNKFEDDGTIYDSVQKIYNLISQYGNYEFNKAEFIYETHKDFNIPFTKDNIINHGLQLELV